MRSVARIWAVHPAVFHSVCWRSSIVSICKGCVEMEPTILVRFLPCMNHVSMASLLSTCSSLSVLAALMAYGCVSWNDGRHLKELAVLISAWCVTVSRHVRAQLLHIFNRNSRSTETPLRCPFFRFFVMHREVLWWRPHRLIGQTFDHLEIW